MHKQAFTGIGPAIGATLGAMSARKDLKRKNELANLQQQVKDLQGQLDSRKSEPVKEASFGVSFLTEFDKLAGGGNQLLRNLISGAMGGAGGAAMGGLVGNVIGGHYDQSDQLNSLADKLPDGIKPLLGNNAIQNSPYGELSDTVLDKVPDSLKPEFMEGRPGPHARDLMGRLGVSGGALGALFGASTGHIYDEKEKLKKELESQKRLGHNPQAMQLLQQLQAGGMGQ